MRRREFITLLGGAAAWPLAARAQQPLRIAKIGHLESGLPSSSPNLLAAFRQGLRELGVCRWSKPLHCVALRGR
jgi:putative tryptophan/tyrosine transport system substrate-binding protein